MGKTKNIILYSLVIIMVVALIFYFKFVFLNNNLLIGDNIDNQVEDGLVDESIVTEADEETITAETQEKTLTEKETNGIKYKISSRMESEENGKEIILYDVVTSDIKEEKLRILTEKIAQDTLKEVKTEKIVLFFHKNESLLGVEFNAQAMWVSGKISIDIAQEN